MADPTASSRPVPSSASRQRPTPLAGNAVGASGSASASRRSFFKDSGLLLAGGALVGGPLPGVPTVHSFGSDVIRIGLVGCGGRGTAAAIQALNTSGGEVRLTAMADAFEHNLQSAYRSIKGKHPQLVDVTPATRFVGLDAYQSVLGSDIDLVILATPPGFRPLHFERAIEAGKHVFMEKPVAVDAPGVRRVLAAGQLAQKKGLAVQVGLQRRHEARYRECIERLHDGAIGEPVFARAYWNGAGVWTRPRRPGQTELEYQIHNWYYFNWLSGDHITEQHVHNLDVINWVMNGFPVTAQGQGGRQMRTGEHAGQIYDHHMVEFGYPGGARMLSQCRHMAGCWSNVSEHIHGTDGYCEVSTPRIFDRRGNLVWESKTQEIAGKGWQQEQIDLFAAIRAGQVPNETEYAAHSTMTAIMGRMATYSGKLVSWNQALSSNLSLADVDSMHSFDSPSPIAPNTRGEYEIAMPGKSVVI